MGRVNALFHIERSQWRAWLGLSSTILARREGRFFLSDRGFRNFTCRSFSHETERDDLHLGLYKLLPMSGPAAEIDAQ